MADQKPSDDPREEFLKKFEKLQQLSTKILHQAQYSPRVKKEEIFLTQNPFPLVAFLFAKAQDKRSRSFSLLLKNDFYQDAEAIARMMAEAYFHLRYILMDKKEHAVMWLHYYNIEALKELEKRKEKVQTDETTALYKKVKFFGKDYLRKNKLEVFQNSSKPSWKWFRENWHPEKNLSDLIKKLTDNPDPSKFMDNSIYNFFYSSVSQWIHSSPFCMINFIDDNDVPIINFFKNSQIELAMIVAYLSLSYSLHILATELEYAESELVLKLVQELNLIF
ncbi:MAG TPA: DUF5677 domain-containing protein [bacterium]|nr:DUF5677 domain-containing protein [bacterium]